MKIKKALLFFALGLILSSCAQSTAMLGPAITLVSTGNVSQAGITFVTNKAVQEETGMDTVSYVSKKIEQNNSKTKLRREFKRKEAKLIENLKQQQAYVSKKFGTLEERRDYLQLSLDSYNVNWKHTPQPIQLHVHGFRFVQPCCAPRPLQAGGFELSSCVQWDASDH